MASPSMSRGKKRRPSRRAEIPAHEAARPPATREDRRNGIIIILMALPMLALGIAILWFVVESMQRGYVDVEYEPGLLSRRDDPFAFYLENGLTAALGLFCGAMGLEMMLNGIRDARGQARRANARRR